MSRGLFLDLDGTLADSLDLLRDVYFLFMKHYGREGTASEFETLNGPPLSKLVSYLAEKHQLTPPIAELRMKYQELVDTAYIDVRPNDGAREILATAVESGWFCGIVTSNSEKLTSQWLEKWKLSSYILSVTGKESVQMGKPHPEPYLIALRRLFCEPHLSLAVEDTVAGVEAATTAGIRTIAFVPAKSKQLGFSQSVPQIQNLTELSKWIAHA